MGATESAAGDAFDRVVGHWPAPMVIATAAVDGRRAGCLVGFATQCSIDPGRFLVCLSKANHTWRTVESGRIVLGVHLLAASDHQLAELFGAETGDEVDKFARCDWQPGPEGVPLLAACPDRFVGREVARLDAGDHVAVVLEPVFASGRGPERPLTTAAASDITPGHPA